MDETCIFYDNSLFVITLHCFYSKDKVHVNPIKKKLDYNFNHMKFNVLLLFSIESTPKIHLAYWF